MGNIKFQGGVRYCEVCPNDPCEQPTDASDSITQTPCKCATNENSTDTCSRATVSLTNGRTYDLLDLEADPEFLDWFVSWIRMKLGNHHLVVTEVDPSQQPVIGFRVDPTCDICGCGDTVNGTPGEWTKLGYVDQGNYHEYSIPTINWLYENMTLHHLSPSQINFFKNKLTDLRSNCCHAVDAN